jgi:hypothetical protein
VPGSGPSNSTLPRPSYTCRRLAMAGDSYQKREIGGALA